MTNADFTYPSDLQKFLLSTESMAVIGHSSCQGHSIVSSLASVYFYDRALGPVDHTAEVLAGLRAEERYISPKFFYEKRGSHLFTEITHQPEYYLTRVETSLLRGYSQEIGQLIGENGGLLLGVDRRRKRRSSMRPITMLQGARRP